MKQHFRSTVSAALGLILSAQAGCWRTPFPIRADSGSTGSEVSGILVPEGRDGRAGDARPLETARDLRESRTLAECTGTETICHGDCVDTEVDVLNCGWCGNACEAIAPSTARCAQGRCLVTLASHQRFAWDLVVSGSAVFWATDEGVMQIPSAGGQPVMVAAAESGPRKIAVDATSVYWTEHDRGTVMKAALGGGAATTLASGQPGPWFIALGSAAAYWTNSDASETEASLATVALDGGGSTPLFFGASSSWPALAVDDMNVYWVSSGQNIMKMGLRGGAPVRLASGQGNSVAMVTDAASVYWVNYDGGTVMKVAKAGGAPVTLASSQPHPWGIAVDATAVYWRNAGWPPSECAIMKALHTGGAPITLASGLDCQWPIAVDDSSVYWVNTGTNGSVMKLTPK